MTDTMCTMKDGRTRDAVPNVGGPMQDEAHPRSPFFGWEWLKTPALLMLLIGSLGLFCQYSKLEIASRLMFLRFPPVWSSWILIGGGLVFSAISAMAYRVRFRQPLKFTHRKSWRSL